MGRLEEVRALAGAVNQTTRTIILHAASELARGKLDRAAGIVSYQVRKQQRASVTWAGILLALESAELRLGGAVRYNDPRPPVEVDLVRDGDYLVEEWGSMDAKVYPEGDVVAMNLSSKPNRVMLLAYAGVVNSADREAVDVLRVEVERFLGTCVELYAAEPRKGR